MLENWDWKIDGWIVLSGGLCAVSAALLGNFLVLRRMSLMGDAISHAILPGLVGAFLVTGQRNGVVMFAGAAAVGVLTVLLIEFARQFGRVDEGASIGVVFTFLFAVGLLLIVLAADRVDLDPSCVLYGILETAVIDDNIVWGRAIPRIVVNLSMVLVLNLVFVVGLFRALKISTFDQQLAASQGVPVVLLHYLLAAFVAITAVASFESVGNILVVAMFVVPPASAWLLTDRLSVMVALSVVIAAASAVLGHLAAMEIPSWFGYRFSTNTAGMMAVAAGCILVLCAFFAPRKGILPRAIRSLRLGIQILSEDVLAALYRAEQQGQPSLAAGTVRANLLVSGMRAMVVLAYLRWHGYVAQVSGQLSLAAKGRIVAQNTVRSHRLWEQYLASEAGFPESLLHEGAEWLEHFTNRTLRERLLAETNAPDVDPHGQPIPPEAHD
ncbi:MAG: metal ABC transporter permease [Planctomycetales bacterium]|nr:metal ABC transporter permease [Planctomycetales bacterium]